MPRGPGVNTVASRAAASPAAERAVRSRWRDPRLAVGIALLAASTVLGARFLGGFPDTVAVWAARGPMPEGRQVGTADLVRRQVRFADQADADRYLSAARGLPAGATLGRAVGAGELLPRGALAASGRGVLTEVPLAVETEAVPATVAVGSTVDVWVTPDLATGANSGSSRARPDRSTLVFDDVTVVAVPRTASTLGPATTRQVIVGVRTDQQDLLPTSIAALSRGRILLTTRR